MLMLMLVLVQNPHLGELLLERWRPETSSAGLIQSYRQLRPNGPEAADENALNDLGYRLLGKQEEAAALAVFQLNTELFPHRVNSWDSLAETHLAMGQPDAAVKYFGRAFDILHDRVTWDRLGAAVEALQDSDVSLEHLIRGTVAFPGGDSEDALFAFRLQSGEVEHPLSAFASLQARFPRSGLWRSRRALARMGSPAPDRNDGWTSSSYQRVGLEATGFDHFLKRARNGAWPKLHGMVVVKGGAIIGEAYFEGFTRYRPHDTRSAGKSLTSLLVGVAVDQNRVRPEQKLYDFFPQYRRRGDWSVAKDKTTLHHLLMMSSGLDAFDDGRPSAGGENNYQLQPSGWLGTVLSLSTAFEPGEKLVYASADYFLLGAVLDQVYGQGFDGFAERYVFEPLGIRDYRWYRTPAGRAYGAGGIRLTPRDMAKLGQLVLNQGLWQGRRVVSGEWIKTMTAAKSNQKLWGSRYGYGWYIREIPTAGKTITAYTAAGNGGQRIWVIPELDAVLAATMGRYNRREQMEIDQILVEVIVPTLIP